MLEPEVGGWESGLGKPVESLSVNLFNISIRICSIYFFTLHKQLTFKLLMLSNYIYSGSVESNNEKRSTTFNEQERVDLFLMLSISFHFTSHRVLYGIKFVTKF